MQRNTAAERNLRSNSTEKIETILSSVNQNGNNIIFKSFLDKIKKLVLNLLELQTGRYSIFTVHTKYVYSNNGEKKNTILI